LFLLYRLRELGLSVRVFETGDGVGGTWYWNRYPGARLDSESYSYGYAFSDELLKEWKWSEHFAAQPELERYFNHVADKFDLKRDIEFNARVRGARFVEGENRWHLDLESGRRARARYLIAAVGMLSEPNMPQLAGLDDFKGEVYHTARWPKEPVDVEGKRVGVLGTGASGVQIITALAPKVEHLTVFQRTPIYSAPMRNDPIDDETWADIQANYPALIKQCRESAAGFMFDFDARSALDTPADERLRRYEELWKERGFKKWLGNYHDIMQNEEANETFASFVREKIRERVHDPEIAAKVVPTGYPLGGKRIPLESGYYETFNRSNVSLVDLRETPLVRINETGVLTEAGQHDVDILVLATGFDALTGAVVAIDLEGVGGERIKDHWSEGPRTYLGLQPAGFPNFFLSINASLCNYPRCIENIVDWITDCIAFMTEKGLTRIEATAEAEEQWMAHRRELADVSVFADWAVRGGAWFAGGNVEGKKKEMLFYLGTNPQYRQKCDDVASGGYVGFDLE
jgi:cation diffusion facilitator CzcD-associated flavoprotein CzcO